uniref:Gap junction protein epsilon 1 n=1 Tax=Nomascus leucogenys TaxID=61853 RepID=A0A2I3H1M1_NOMLE
MFLNYIKNFYEGCVKPPTVIGQFHTLFFGLIRMFFLGVLGFAVYGNEALHFICDPDKKEVNLFCYNWFSPITPQVSFSALQLVIVLVPGAIFHLYAACKSINQECILQKSIYTIIYILSILLRISLEAIAFWLQIYLFGFQVKSLYLCDARSLRKNMIIRCMVPEHFEKMIFLIAMNTFTAITMVLCVAEIFEIIFRRLYFPFRQ